MHNETLNESDSFHSILLNRWWRASEDLSSSETDGEKITSLRRRKVIADHGWEDRWALCSINSLVESDEQHVHDDRAHRCRLFLKWIDRGSGWIESRYNNNTELSNRFIICLFGRRIIGTDSMINEWFNQKQIRLTIIFFSFDLRCRDGTRENMSLCLHTSPNDNTFTDGQTHWVLGLLWRQLFDLIISLSSDYWHYCPRLCRACSSRTMMMIIISAWQV